jgi:hypothetical protein
MEMKKSSINQRKMTLRVRVAKGQVKHRCVDSDHMVYKSTKRAWVWDLSLGMHLEG